ncbi:MAG: PQQ-binding-like beta-propeller repeat protein, partial [Sedimentisphaerales bacterium]|nr:PQQ-binding-like beta-propeller repeat protein [Sedimentisphaerales bacterium]
LAQKSKLLIYLQLSNAEDVEAARQAADAAGYYGPRIYVEKGSMDRIHLADNLADAVIAVGKTTKLIDETEVLRVLRPQGKALIGKKELTKPFPDGIDDWSHPYHGPDNNPQSQDRLARAPYLTQFLANPRYAPVPQVAVASAGRVFKAFGHIAPHLREEPYLNQLVAFNGYNGTILWKRPLAEGYMVHRNTIIATPYVLYVGDDKSCKLINPVTGALMDEIIPPTEITGGTFWKWMALENGILYAMVGRQEHKDPPTHCWKRTEHGWLWNQVSKGFNLPENPWGFGHTILAVDPKSQKVLWHYREDKPIDSRAVCMKNGRIFLFGYKGVNQGGAFLTCLDAKTGKPFWRKTPEKDPELFQAIGKHLNRQGWRTNFRTTAFLKCSDEALYFAGPQVEKLLAVSTGDGSILWQNPYSNFQLVLRDDGLYGFSGPADKQQLSEKLDPITGEVLARLKTARRACTRPTGSADSIFYRATGGTARLDIAKDSVHWISPMRPPCFDGVTIANGLLYWWPFVCDCQLTLYGITCLGPAGDFDFAMTADTAERLETNVPDLRQVAPFSMSPADWPTFRADNTCSATSTATIADTCDILWQYKPDTKIIPTPTAPVAAGGLVFTSGFDGIVRAFDGTTGKLRWKAYTGGPVRLPPTIWKGRVLVGSGDGWAYAFEAATGRLLWRFRGAPAERKIPVYGTLMSTWPIAGGVLVDDDGTAYLAAGIVNYDGTHVYALDGATGKLKWQNNTSGHLDPEARCGVSVHGHLLLHGGKLYMPGGTSISPAIYNITDGKCLNDVFLLRQTLTGNKRYNDNNIIITSVSPRGWELSLVAGKVVAYGQPYYGDPRYSVYEPTVSNKIHLASTGERDIVWLDNKKVMCFATIDRKILRSCVTDKKVTNSYIIQTWGKLKIPDKPLWIYNCNDSVAMAVCRNAVLIAGKSELTALNLQKGEKMWSQPLPASPVPWGLAVDRNGSVIVSLKNGQVLCFGSDRRVAVR